MYQLSTSLATKAITTIQVNQFEDVNAVVTFTFGSEDYQFSKQSKQSSTSGVAVS
jgi:hypothetical protein